MSQIKGKINEVLGLLLAIIGAGGLVYPVVIIFQHGLKPVLHPVTIAGIVLSLFILIAGFRLSRSSKTKGGEDKVQ